MSGSNNNTFPGFGGGRNSGGTNAGSSGGSGGGSNSDSCELLFDQTILNSPNAEVISGLKQGDELTIEEQNSILYAKKDGNIAGSISSPRIVRFIECIREGHQYVGLVESVLGGKCEITIRPKA